MTVRTILAGKGGVVITTPPHRTLAEIATLLAERHIGAVIVTGSDGEVLGILVAVNRRRKRFDEWDETLLGSLAAQAGAGIQRLRVASGQTHRLEHDLSSAPAGVCPEVRRWLRAGARWP